MSEQKKYEHILVEMPREFDKDGNIIKEGIDGNYAIISINRPDKLNAIQQKTVEEIASTLYDLELNSDVRCVVLRGTKDYTKKPSFSTGQDLSSPLDPRIKPNIPAYMALLIHRYHKSFDSIDAFPKPLIAAIDGYALGGGSELALVCDLIISSKRSVFGFTEIQRGIFPSAGGTQRMVRNIGLARATQMLFLGEHHPAAQMYEWGLVNFLVENDNFEQTVHEIASKIGNSATTSLMVIKKCLRFGSQVPLNVGLQLEQLGFGVNSASEDVTEGVRAFLRRKEPNFKGF
jgi:enoyl-CoA hydratase/3-hydroxyacyl-CoA dehydrogenase